MERSEQLNELAAALCAAQAEIEDASKAKVNPAFRSKYADLGSVWDACKPALVKHGLSVAQVSHPSDTGTLALETVLLHKSGQFISGIMTMPLSKHDPQGYGSALTYARRYGLGAMVGVCPEDDDANAATHRPPANGPAPTQAYRPAAPPPDTKQGAAVDAYRPPVPNGMMVMNPGPGQCPACHAPEGKLHMKNCQAVLQPA